MLLEVVLVQLPEGGRAALIKTRLRGTVMTAHLCEMPHIRKEEFSCWSQATQGSETPPKLTPAQQVMLL